DNVTPMRGFLLALSYVLAMAVAYTVVGILAGLFGANLQAWFQNPWILTLFAVIFVLLSLSMFGFYELQMPASIQSKLTAISNNQEGGKFLSAAIMGLLSALIVGPCVTAPLIGALIYIGQTGDAVLGGMALFALSIGMGAPLLLIGASAGTLLPKAGAWMEAVKGIFGVMLLGVAIWLLERILPAPASMLLWALLLIVSGVYMGALRSLPEGLSKWHQLWKGLGFATLLYGVLIMVGVAAGGRDVLQPLKGAFSGPGAAQSEQGLAFQRVKGLDGFRQALAQAKAAGRPVMLDFYADWCISCKEMEHQTFTDPAVKAALGNAVLLQADLTANDDQDRALLKHFGVVGPPAIMFFNTQGEENKPYRVVGFMPPDRFAAHVRQALGQ
ncbi:MAG TPA: protein-disulfide reductase DsbD, partial [Gammaproteobacteria bacterium]|nr:protein-disulfide reductase DsbD [Gammaproteobacteria bacterium]